MFKRETFDSAVDLGISALEFLGNSHAVATRAGKLFSQHDRTSLFELAEIWGDNQRYGLALRKRMDDLKQVIERDKIEQTKLSTCKTKTKI